MIVVNGILILAGIYLSCYVLQWVILLYVFFVFSERRVPMGTARRRFAILVPAHNEEMHLARLLESIRQQDYPAELFSTIVVADNCTDGTAAIARQHGANVLERFDEGRRGKGFALHWAFENVDLSICDVVVIVDADCFISSNALRSLDGSFQDFRIVQCYSGVGNPEASWFTRLLDVSRTINNIVYNPAKQRLGLSSQLIGTGMCFATPILRKYGWDAFTIGEDCEYYAKVVGQGEKVGFNIDARIYHQESTTLGQATSQRIRWSSGRFAVASKYGLGLLLAGLQEGNAVKIEAGLGMLLPNPSLGMNLTLTGLFIAFAASSGTIDLLVAWFLVLALCQLALFVVGVMRTRNRLKNFLAIFVAPVFLVWKLCIDAISFLGLGGKRWIRTTRKL